jgi:membrane complex biogenesis BtpA family protein
MIALAPLPGAPLYRGDPTAVLAQAMDDLEQYREAGVEAIVVENSLDLPYVKPPLPRSALELVQRICGEIRARFAGPIGIQLLEAANEQALEIAARTGLDFVRVEGYVFAHIGGAGLIEGCAGRLHRLRRDLGCTQVKLIADIKKKHCSHALTGDLTIADVARQAHFFLADGLVVTGSRTGQEPAEADLRAVREAVELPLWIGSGMNPRNIGRYRPLADAFIVGSCLRRGGEFTQRLAPDRLAAFVAAYRSCGSEGEE